MLTNTSKDGTGTSYWAIVDSNGYLIVGGQAAHDAAAAGNPVRAGGVYRSTDPAVATGDIADLLVDAAGRLLIKHEQLELTVLSSAARTATTNSSDFTNQGARGIILTLDVTAVTDTPEITLSVTWKDPVTSDYITIFTASAAVSTVTRTTYVLYPIGSFDVSDTEMTEASVTALPRTWRVTVTHGDADSITYSVGGSYLL